MSEDKLENFGTLLKKSLENRGEDIGSTSDETVTLSDSERSIILEKLVHKDKDASAQPPSADGSSGDTAMASFGTLLEQTVEIQENMRKDDHKEEDKVREKVIEKSKMDMVGKMMKSFGF